MSSDDLDERLGTRLGNYVLREVIGRGGMGVVYRGEHVYIHKLAAIKVLHPRHFAEPEARQRFLREAQTASIVDHPNIVGITDFGEAPDGTVFLVMERAEGTGLDQVLRVERTLPLFRALGIAGQVARALGAAHDKGVVHRDLKPENIMLSQRPGRREIVRAVMAGAAPEEVVEPEGTFDFVTLLDFGAAKFFDQSVVPLKAGSTVIGTPTYMPPETAKTGVADARSDIYALGVILYEMLTGTVPFDADSAIEIMKKQIGEAVEPPSRRNPSVEISAEAERAILKALEKDPAARYQSMLELDADLQRAYGAVRFRRPRPGADADVEALRKPVPLTAKKERSAESLPAVGAPPDAGDGTARGAGKAAATAGEGRPSAPVLLTRRKTTERHGTLPFGAAPPDVKPGTGKTRGKG